MKNNIDLNKRKYYVRNAIASFALEGEHPSPFVLGLLMKYEKGEIETIEELRRITNEGNPNYGIRR